MPFELPLRYTTPLTPLGDVNEVLREFLRLVGYLPEGDDGRSTEGPIETGVAFRLVRECFVAQPERAWYVEEIAARLGTSRPTIYRHINKLKTLDLLEEVGEVNDGKGRKGYRLRYGNLARAWDFTEAHAQNALRRYRDTVNHLETLIEKERERPRELPAEPAPRAAPAARARSGGR